MKNLIIAFAAVGLSLGYGMPIPGLAGESTKGKLMVADLSCEYATDPLGIDTAQPRFTWTLKSLLRGQMQSAYHIIVAGSEGRLHSGVGDRWDSGRVHSEKSVNISYEGRPLASGEKCYWKVRVWDKDGRPSDWSKAAIFEMGLLHDSDWQGQWIGMAEPDDGACYIPGKHGRAIALNGKNESVRIEHYRDLKPAKEITISAWIKPNDHFSDRWQEIYRKEDGISRCLLAYGKTGDQTGLWFGLGIGGVYTENCAPLAIESVKDGGWHLVAVVYDGSAKRFHFDGCEIARKPISGPIDTRGSRPAYIGSNNGRNEFFPGGIDDVRIYARALSPGEV